MSNYLTDEEARDLAQKFTQWNGSHAMTNYPMLLNAAIKHYLEKHGEVVAWQWKKRVIGWHEKDVPQYVWTEWEALQPPYMDARSLSKADPENYEVRPVYAAPPAHTPRAAGCGAGAQRLDDWCAGFSL